MGEGQGEKGEGQGEKGEGQGENGEGQGEKLNFPPPRALSTKWSLLKTYLRGGEIGDDHLQWVEHRHDSTGGETALASFSCNTKDVRPK